MIGYIKILVFNTHTIVIVTDLTGWECTWYSLNIKPVAKLKIARFPEFVPTAKRGLYLALVADVSGGQYLITVNVDSRLGSIPREYKRTFGINPWVYKNKYYYLINVNILLLII